MLRKKVVYDAYLRQCETCRLKVDCLRCGEEDFASRGQTQTPVISEDQTTDVNTLVRFKYTIINSGHSVVVCHVSVEASR